MKILVTGAAGFIGSHVLTRMSADHELFAVRRGSQPASAEPSAEVSWITCDLANPQFIQALPQAVDAVVHLAQSSKYREFPECAADIFDVNVASTMALLAYARNSGARHFVLASTGSVYSGGSGGYTEANCPAPASFYGASKQAAECLLPAYAEFFATTALRIFFPYGPRQPPQMLLPRLVRSILSGEAVTLEGETGISINPIYVSDVADAIAGCVSLTDSAVLNVAGERVLSIRELSQTIGKLVGVEPVFTQRPAREPAQFVGDIERYKSSLGGPRVSLEEGLAIYLDQLNHPADQGARANP